MSEAPRESATLEDTARMIAERGREMLIARLRPAFEEAAKAHADVVKLDAEQLERMIRQAADRADGLQWRRALAAVATKELGIGLGEALSHPAVVRAQAIAGAPAYEESLAELGVTPAGASKPARAPTSAAPTSAAPASKPASATKPAPTSQPAPAPTTREAPAPSDHEPGTGTTRPLRLSAIHLGGVASLAHGERDVELSFAESGVDILRGAGELLGRLPWTRIRALELPQPRARLLRRREPRGQIVIRTADGVASFEIPGVLPAELQERLGPVAERYGIDT